MPLREDYEDDTSVEALQRFLVDPATLKTILQLASVYQRALHPDDDTVDDLEFPELGRNDRIIVMKALFELLSELMGDPGDSETDELEDDEEYASVNLGGLGVEVAKDKRMSTYYKAFMGKMRDLVGPWHSDKNKWLEKWTAMGMDLYAKSPADAPETDLKLVIERDRESDESDAPQFDEEAAVVDSTAALPTKVMRELTNMGFTPLAEAEEGESAWVKSGANDGFPERQVILVRRADESYLVIYSNVSKFETYGQVQKRRTLDEGASAETLLRVIAYMYDAMIEA